jgi:hypothetical protein
LVESRGREGGRNSLPQRRQGVIFLLAGREHGAGAVLRLRLLRRGWDLGRIFFCEVRDFVLSTMQFVPLLSVAVNRTHEFVEYYGCCWSVFFCALIVVLKMKIKVYIMYGRQ